MNLSAYRKLQKYLLATFCLSVAVSTVSLFIAGAPAGSETTNVSNINTKANNMMTPTPVPTNAHTPTNNTPVNFNSAANQPAGETGGDGLLMIGVVTFLTSITSLLGFISTTVLAWRKEKRETATIRFENEKKELELEKLKWELEKMKSEAKESKPKRARKPKKTE